MASNQKSPQSYNGRTLEQKKSAFDRELLEIYLSLKNFNWLLGLRFARKSDHQPLVRALGMKSPTPQQSRWLSYISEFNCEVQHIPGAENIEANALSRSIFLIGTNLDGLPAKEQAKHESLQALFRNPKFTLVETEVEAIK